MSVCLATGNERNTDPAEAAEAVPGGVYLCQVSETVSCGACCGLYNVADPSRTALQTMLAKRTARFVRLPRNMDAILDFAVRTESEECQQRPYPDFHHCPYIGLIGKDRSRVGCLLHPLGGGNAGVDWRGLSHYGGMACRVYFCPATRALEPRYKKVLRLVLQDWHTFGLIATERHLVAALLGVLETRLARFIDPGAVAESPAQCEALADLLRIKIDWPHRRRSRHLCHDFFADRMRLPQPAAVRGDNGRDGAYSVILGELETDASCMEARTDLDRRLAAAERALR